MPNAADVPVEVGVQQCLVGAEGCDAGTALLRDLDDSVPDKLGLIHHRSSNCHQHFIASARPQPFADAGRVGGGKNFEATPLLLQTVQHGSGKPKRLGQAKEVAPVREQAEVHKGRYCQVRRRKLDGADRVRFVDPVE